MLQIVGALILLIAGFAILRLLFRALISTASALAGLILLCLFGPALLAGYITETHNPVVPYSLAGRRISDDCRNDHQPHVGT
ncbi:CP4-44 prophage; putative membrane protein [Escherichia coli]|uniref:CP4-44 prophage putative membrane protein n=1 Tax=Escherichia coli TaxID=562 RepID=A0A376RKG0_ECOLX|nr:CP4-44 prophage; putative membrane protein [Escherichia coli]